MDIGIRNEIFSNDLKIISYTMLFIVPFVLATGLLILKYVPRFIKAWTYPKPAMIHLHQEVEYLIRTTQQIKKEWSEMNSMVDQVHDRHSRFATSAHCNVQALQESLRQAKKDASKRPSPTALPPFCVTTLDALCSRMARMRAEASKQAEEAERELDQEEEERDDHREKTIAADNDSNVKDAIAVVKKLLKDFLKEHKKNVHRGREEMKKNVRDMTDGLKGSIASVFLSTTPANTEKKRRKRILELSNKMQLVETSLKMSDAEVSSTKKVLDGIDAQLDGIYGELQLEELTMSEQIEDAAARTSTVVAGLKDITDALEDAQAALAKAASEDAGKVSACAEGVEQVSATLNQFAARVEVPMKRLVCNMRFLYDSVSGAVCRARDPLLQKGGRKRTIHERGDVPDATDSDVKRERVARDNIHGLIQDLKVRTTRKTASAQDHFSALQKRRVELRGKQPFLLKSSSAAY